MTIATTRFGEESLTPRVGFESSFEPQVEQCDAVIEDSCFAGQIVALKLLPQCSQNFGSPVEMRPQDRQRITGAPRSGADDQKMASQKLASGVRAQPVASTLRESATVEVPAALCEPTGAHRW